MDRFGPRLLRRGYDLIDDEIRLGGRRRPDMDGFVRHLDVEGVTVGIGIDGNRLDPEPARGLHDAAGNFAPIGNEKFPEHGSPLLSSLRFLEACEASKLAVATAAEERRRLRRLARFSRRVSLPGEAATWLSLYSAGGA